MLQRLKFGLGQFCREESGNVTVDWVVLLSGIVGMTFMVMFAISGGVQVFGDSTEAELTARDVGY